MIVMALFHLGALAAVFMFNWRLLVAGLFLYGSATGLGISMGYHRLLTHRSYQVPLLLEYFFAVCGTLWLRHSGRNPSESSIGKRGEVMFNSFGGANAGNESMRCRCGVLA
jgi:hypothetical protein